MAEKRRRRMGRLNSVKKRQKLDALLTLQVDECCFCREGENPLCGTFFQDENVSLAAHQYCLFFSAGLPQRGEDDEGFDGFLYKDILKEAQRASKIVCKFCKLPGASLGCCIKTCRLVCHYKCGVKQGMQFVFYDCFDTYCTTHRMFQDLTVLMKARRLSNPAYLCPLCLEEVEDDHNTTVKTPCCKNVFAHKACIQTQAMVSGYFFRCPTCNDEARFQNEMAKFGIYIPQRDAAWEENNAFQDLLEQYQKCDAPDCRCPNGNSYVEEIGVWEILRCFHCGQSAIHRCCLDGKVVPGYQFICIDCNDVIGVTTSPPVVAAERRDERFAEHKKRLTELKQKNHPVLFASPVFAACMWREKFDIKDCWVVVKLLPNELIQNLRGQKINIKRLSHYGIFVNTSVICNRNQRKLQKSKKVENAKNACDMSLHQVNEDQAITKELNGETNVLVKEHEDEYGKKVTDNDGNQQAPLSKTAAKIMACISSSPVMQLKRQLSDTDLHSTHQKIDVKKSKLERLSPPPKNKQQDHRAKTRAINSKLLIKFQFGHSKRSLNRPTSLQNNASNLLQSDALLLQNNATSLEKNASDLLQSDALLLQNNASSLEKNATSLQNYTTSLQNNVISLQNDTISLPQNCGETRTGWCDVTRANGNDNNTTQLNDTNTDSNTIPNSSAVQQKEETRRSDSIELAKPGKSSVEHSILVLSSPETPISSYSNDFLNSSLHTSPLQNNLQPQTYFPRKSTKINFFDRRNCNNPVTNHTRSNNPVTDHTRSKNPVTDHTRNSSNQNTHHSTKVPSNFSKPLDRKRASRTVINTAALYKNSDIYDWLRRSEQNKIVATPIDLTIDSPSPNRLLLESLATSQATVNSSVVMETNEQQHAEVGCSSTVSITTETIATPGISTNNSVTIYFNPSTSKSSTVHTTNVTSTGSKSMSDDSESETAWFQNNISPPLPGIHTFVSACWNSLPSRPCTTTGNNKKTAEATCEFEPPKPTRIASLSIVETINTSSHHVNVEHSLASPGTPKDNTASPDVIFPTPTAQSLHRTRTILSKFADMY